MARLTTRREGSTPLPSNLAGMSSNRPWIATAKRFLATVVATAALLAIGGFFMFRHQTPVTIEQAVERFRAGNDGTTSGRYEVHRRRTRVPGRDSGAIKVTRRESAGTRTIQGGSNRQGPAVVASPRSPHFDVMPAEGVYLYEGSGREGVDPYSRSFDPNTERIITHDDRDTWTEHHLFSQQRASWTKITTSETGRIVHGQRNDITIGPDDAIDETRHFPFNPALQATVFPPPSTGTQWQGRFTGQTQKGESYTGSYEVRALEDGHWAIGGIQTRVLGYRMDVEFEGDVEGTVRVSYWFAPAYGVTVREDYRIDARVGIFDYWGEWFVTLRSLTPRT